MSLTALLLVLASSLGWAGFDALRKHLAVRLPTVPLTAVVITVQVIPLAVWALADGAGHPDPGYLLPGGVALILNTAANVLFIKALSLAALSLTVPLLSLTPVFTLLAAIPLLSERPTGLQIMGIALVALGALALGRAGSPEDQGPDRRAVVVGSLVMVSVALLWAVTGPVDKLALRHAAPAMHALVQASGVAMVLLFVAVIRGEGRDLAHVFRRYGALSAAALCASAGLGLQLLAIQRTLVSLVETIKRAVGMAGSLLNGRLFFDESITRAKLVAVGMMATGVALTLLQQNRF